MKRKNTTVLNQKDCINKHVKQDDFSHIFTISQRPTETITASEGSNEMTK